MSLHEMLYEMPKKRLLHLRNTRVKRLYEEQKSMEELQKKQEREQEREMARNQIMKPE